MCKGFSGSSPRVWGQVLRFVLTVLHTGIIPTRVGTRKHTITLVNGNKDHPHACGDKINEQNDKEVEKGSSPRVWGQVRAKVCTFAVIRIIPTRVGTRQISVKVNPEATDHPHACGDKLNFLWVRLMRQGSSPRVWGQVPTVKVL